jgi:hypothetical protein
MDGLCHDDFVEAPLLDFFDIVQIRWRRSPLDGISEQNWLRRLTSLHVDRIFLLLSVQLLHTRAIELRRTLSSGSDSHRMGPNEWGR